MSKLRKALIVIWVVTMAASLYGWLRYSSVIATRTEPTPREVKVRVVPIAPVAPVPNQPTWHQEAKTIQIEKMVEAGKAEWQRDAAARRGHTEP
jgi:hypothetical protein